MDQTCDGQASSLKQSHPGKHCLDQPPPNWLPDMGVTPVKITELHPWFCRGIEKLSYCCVLLGFGAACLKQSLSAAICIKGFGILDFWVYSEFFHYVVPGFSSSQENIPLSFLRLLFLSHYFCSLLKETQMYLCWTFILCLVFCYLFTSQILLTFWVDFLYISSTSLNQFSISQF